MSDSRRRPERTTCPVCRGRDLEVFFETEGCPAFCNVLWPTREEALSAPVGDIRLGLCRRCGMVHNVAFDPGLLTYGQAYENSLHFSPTFQGYAETLARRLVDAYGLTGKTVVEIGSGKGDFLALLCDLGVGRGVGYDPSYGGESDVRVGDGRVTFVRGLYPEGQAALDADFVCCRHVLEHLDRPADLVRGLRRGLHPRTGSYFEMPDGSFLLRAVALWDVIYEHPQHFTPPALRRLFVEAGFSVTALGSSFGGQYLWIEAAPCGDERSEPQQSGARDDPEVAELAGLVSAFSEQAAAKVERFAAELRSRLDAGGRVALWGAGSKGVTFLNLVPGGDRVGCVVDVNPRKHGRYVPVTGQPVVGPEELRAFRPDAVLVMNPLYELEIRAMLGDLGVEAEAVSVEGALA